MKLKFLIVLMAAVPVMVLTSCLKSRDSLGISKDPGSTSTGIFDRYYYGAAKAFVLEGVPPIETLSDFMTIRMSSPRKAAGTIHVVLAVDNSLVTAYNSANGTSYLQLPAAAYTFPTLSVDIPAGTEASAVLPMILNKNNMNLQFSYALGLKIVSVSEGVISENEKNIVATFLVKNKYDGRYELLGFHNRDPYQDPYDEEVWMYTTGPTSVKMFWPAANLFAHPIAGGTTYYGTLTMEFIFDATTDALSAVNNPYTPGSPPFTVGPAPDSRYVPATKTIYAQYYYNANLQRMFTDTLHYLGARP